MNQIAENIIALNITERTINPSSSVSLDTRWNRPLYNCSKNAYDLHNGEEFDKSRLTYQNTQKAIKELMPNKLNSLTITIVTIH